MRYITLILSSHFLYRFYILNDQQERSFQQEQYEHLLEETRILKEQIEEVNKLREKLAESEKWMEQFQQNLEIREQNIQEMLNYSIAKESYNFNYQHNIIDRIISVCYSKTANQNEIAKNLIGLAKKSYVLHDALLLYTQNIQTKKVMPKIIFLNTLLEEFNPTIDSTTKAYYDKVDCYIVVPLYEGKYPFDTVIHEIIHADMEIFENDSKPYNSDLSKQKYYLAIKRTLINIKNFLNQNLKSNFDFKDNEHHYEMGKELFYWLFPQYLSANEISKYIDKIRDADLDLNHNFCWLSNKTPLMQALSYDNEALADALLTEGATLTGTAREINMLKLFNSFAHEWINKNTGKLEINNHNYLIKINERNITKHDQLLIEEPCERDKFLSEFNYFEDLLSSYRYEEGKIDDEVIARFVQVIAKHQFEQNIVHILEPLEDFWLDVIHPFTEEVSDFYGIASNMCLPLESLEY